MICIEFPLAASFLRQSQKTFQFVSGILSSNCFLTLKKHILKSTNVTLLSANVSLRFGGVCCFQETCAFRSHYCFFAKNMGCLATFSSTFFLKQMFKILVLKLLRITLCCFIYSTIAYTDIVVDANEDPMYGSHHSASSNVELQGKIGNLAF